MKRIARELALKAQRLSARRDQDHAAIAKKLKVEPENVLAIINRGHLIASLEAHRLNDNELLVLQTLARLEARRVELGHEPWQIGQVDHAAGKRSGFTGKVIAKRLRRPRPTDAGLNDITNRLDFVACPQDAGRIWLTPAGWAFVWATGLVSKNWKVPA